MSKRELREFPWCSSFEIGETVLWRGGWGNQPERSAVIVGKGEKNDRTVYDLDNGHWAYEDQLRKVEGRAS